MLLHNTSHQVNECINTMLRVKRDRCFKCQEMLEESRCFCSQHPGQLVPVEPNPPSPRSVTSRLANSCNQLLPKRPNDKKIKTWFNKPNSQNQNLIIDPVHCQRKIPKSLKKWCVCTKNVHLNLWVGNAFAHQLSDPVPSLHLKVHRSVIEHYHAWQLRADMYV